MELALAMFGFTSGTSCCPDLGVAEIQSYDPGSCNMVSNACAKDP